ncbi:MAG TPA: hypothetical protein VF476_14740 [Chitinophagaceae bacterium]
MKIVIVKSILALLVLLVALLLFITVDNSSEAINRNRNVFNLSLQRLPILATKENKKPGTVTLQVTYDKKLRSNVNLAQLDEEKVGVPLRAEINFTSPATAPLLTLANDQEDFGKTKVQDLTDEQYLALMKDNLRITVYTSFYPEGWLMASTR